MRKILIFTLIFCCNKFILMAQQITSNLTLITTDMMSNEQKSNFNWKNVSYTTTAARYYFPPPIYITLDPTEGTVTGGNGNYDPCLCTDNKCSGPSYLANDGTLLCSPCNDGSTSCRTITHTPLGPGSSSSSNTNFPPIIVIGAGWGNILWGNLGSYYTTGFLNPPSYVPSGGGYSGYSGGGSSAHPPPLGSSYPPPTNLIDDPNGGTNNKTKKKDTIIFLFGICDTILFNFRNLNDSVTSDLKKIRMIDGKLDSIYNKVKDTSYHLEQGFITHFDTNNCVWYNDSIAQGTSNGVALGSAWIKTHTHCNGLFYGPDIIDIYHALTRINFYFQKKRISNYILGADGGIYAVTVYDSTASELFQLKYYQWDHSSLSTDDYFVDTSSLKKIYFDPTYNSLIQLGITKQDAFAYSMAYLMGTTNMGTTLLRSESINEKFYKIDVKIELQNGRKFITVMKCN